MKKLTMMLTAAAGAALLGAGCVNEDPAYSKTEPVPPGQTEAVGFLSLADMTMHVIADTQTDTRPDDTSEETARPSTRAAAQPDVDSYLVEIFDADHQSKERKTYAELKAEMGESGKLELPVGAYTLEVRSEDPAAMPAADWEHPYYCASQEFTIEKDRTTSIGEVVCRLGNIKVTFTCSKDLADQLADHTATTVSLGQTAVIFAKGETRAAYFMPQGETNTLALRLEGAFADTPESPLQITKIITGVKAGQWRKLTLVITHADKGDMKFDIAVENFMQDEEIVIDSTEGTWEPIYEETPDIDPTAPAITWPGHSLAEPFRLTASMFDAEGNCTEPFALELASPNGIASFVLTFESTDEKFLEALDRVQIPRTLDLCTLRPDHPAYSILAGFGFPLGDNLRGATSKRFDIARQMPMLYNNPGFDGTHTFAFTVTDAKGLSTSASLRLIVDRAGETSGAAPTIVWQGNKLDEVVTISRDTQIEIDIAAENGIRSLEVEIISEKLTPEELMSVGVPPRFDLCDVQAAGNYTAEEIARNLQSLGFPVNDQVKDKTVIPTISITKFVGMLFLAASGCQSDFVIRVTDNAGKTTSATLMLYVPSGSQQ